MIMLWKKRFEVEYIVYSVQVFDVHEERHAEDGVDEHGRGTGEARC